MTPDDLRILIQEGEGTTLEFKESLSSSFARELVALANTIGGKILLGVRDDGTVIGMHDSNTLRARIQDIARNCDPPVKVLAEPVGGVFAAREVTLTLLDSTPPSNRPACHPTRTPGVRPPLGSERRTRRNLRQTALWRASATAGKAALQLVRRSCQLQTPAMRPRNTIQIP